jgi:hypothetical protein
MTRKKELFERMLSGERLTEDREDLYCKSCGKKLHEGEDITVSVRYAGDIAYPGGVNCGSCDTKKMKGDVARGHLVSVSDTTQQTHELALAEPQIEEREE